MEDEWLESKVNTLQYQDAIKEATHKGVRTGTLYRKRDDTTLTDFFATSSLCWQQSMVTIEVLEDGVKSGLYSLCNQNK